jgi:predicted methyltransferase
VKKAFLIGAAALGLVACGTQGTAKSGDEDPIAAAVANPDRPEADRARDDVRKPVQIIAFAGVKPGDKIVELVPGGGYFTRMLCKVAGPSGHLYEIVPPFYANRPNGLDGINAVAKECGNVTVMVANADDFKVPEKVDLVWTSENYHDMHNGPNADIAKVDKNLFDALKPGGLFYVEDHSAPGKGTSVTSTLHRMDPAAAISEIEAAGFKLDGQSDALANPDDPHDKPVFDPSIRGKTDKFALRFKKPAM